MFLQDITGLFDETGHSVYFLNFFSCPFHKMVIELIEIGFYNFGNAIYKLIISLIPFIEILPKGGEYFFGGVRKCFVND
jgi:hypothetical protein